MDDPSIVRRPTTFSKVSHYLTVWRKKKSHVVLLCTEFVIEWYTICSNYSNNYVPKTSTSVHNKIFDCWVTLLYLGYYFHNITRQWHEHKAQKYTFLVWVQRYNAVNKNLQYHDGWIWMHLNSLSTVLLSAFITFNGIFCKIFEFWDWTTQNIFTFEWTITQYENNAFFLLFVCCLTLNYII